MKNQTELGDLCACLRAVRSGQPRVGSPHEAQACGPITVELNQVGALQDNGDVLGDLPLDVALEKSVERTAVAIDIPVRPDPQPASASQMAGDTLQAIPVQRSLGALGPEEQDHAVRAGLIDEEGRPPGGRGQPGSRWDARADGPLHGSAPTRSCWAASVTPSPFAHAMSGH